MNLSHHFFLLNLLLLASCQDSTLQSTNIKDSDNQSSTNRAVPLTLDFTSNQNELSSETSQISNESILNLSSSVTKLASSSVGISSLSQFYSSFTFKPSSSQNISSSIPLNSLSSLEHSSSSYLNSNQGYSSSLPMSSSENKTCNNLKQWDTVAWAFVEPGTFYLDEKHESAWSCDATAFCTFPPGSSQSAWIKEFDCEQKKY